MPDCFRGSENRAEGQHKRRCQRFVVVQSPVFLLFKLTMGVISGRGAVSVVRTSP